MKILIVDNDDSIREGLIRMISTFDLTELNISDANGVLDAYEKIKTFNPDTVLLDVEMNDGTGFDLLKKFDSINFQVIFITAHDKYAIEAIKFSAMDYLLKPVDPAELEESLNKAKNNSRSTISKSQVDLLKSHSTESTSEKKIALKDSEAIYITKISDIIQCKAEGAYTKIFFRNQSPLLLSKGLKEFEEMLSNYSFIRCHHSHLVNANAIKRFDKAMGGTLIMEDDSEIPVSFRKKDQIISFLQNI